MCTIAAFQLGAEIYRGMVNYQYPVHDIRLLIVSACSIAFGLCLLGYTILICRLSNGIKVFAFSTLLTLTAVYFAPGFDFKSLLGMVVPLVCGLVLTGIQSWRLRRIDLIQWTAAQSFFLLASWIATAQFHEFLYYLLVAGLLVFLFYQQARQMAVQQKQQQEDQKVIAKLEYQLAQIAARNASTKLEISIGGKTEMIDSNKITYCKAAGDYVELHLQDGSDRLYSGTLKTVESKLPDTFLRVHRSYLVNLSYVTSLHSASSNQNARLELNNETFVDVSRRLLPSVRATLTSS
jgi:DNA-binding LytR/AlgR family response regulator